MFSKDVVTPYFAYVMNTILGDNLVGVTDQLFKIIPYNVIRIDFSKVNSLCCKSFPNLKSLEIQRGMASINRLSISASVLFLYLQTLALSLVPF